MKNRKQRGKEEKKPHTHHKLNLKQNKINAHCFKNVMSY